MSILICKLVEYQLLLIIINNQLLFTQLKLLRFIFNCTNAKITTNDAGALGVP